jgi:hypothetical protein
MILIMELRSGIRVGRTSEVCQSSRGVVYRARPGSNDFVYPVNDGLRIAGGG